MNAWYPIATIAGVLAALGLGTAGWDRPPVESTQEGYRGLGMVQITNLRRYLDKPSVDQLPPEIPPVASGGPMATEQYKNIKVLTDVSAAELMRLMTAMTAWVSPKEGCNYCHESADLASDAKYTKVVSRKMIEMVRHINSDWTSHVANTGVTCYTCHRGNPVPQNIWFNEPDPGRRMGMAETQTGQNHPSRLVGLTSLPADPYAAFLDRPSNIRVIATTALPGTKGATIQQTEYTYGLMMTMSNGLGVNCTFCHNTRSFFDWDQSSPRRVTAWHGIQLVRDVNMTYLEPLKTILPPNRLGPHGGGPRIACGTCHQGASKPLLGANMVKTYPELQGPALAQEAASEPAASRAR